MKAGHPRRRGEAAATVVTALLALIFFLPVRGDKFVQDER
jgi:hypothetical protein